LHNTANKRVVRLFKQWHRLCILICRSLELPVNDVGYNRRSVNKMMKTRYVATLAAVLCVLMTTVGMASAQSRPQDQLAGLKRAITQAGGPALSAQQETALNTLITDFRSNRPDPGDDAIDSAREALDAALLAGDLAAAQVQITIISARAAQLGDARMQALARFQIAALAILKTGGQLDPLVTKYGAERVVDLVGSLAGEVGRPGGPDGGRRH
jgi:hypothetical protein